MGKMSDCTEDERKEHNTEACIDDYDLVLREGNDKRIDVALQLCRCREKTGRFEPPAQFEHPARAQHGYCSIHGCVEQIVEDSQRPFREHDSGKKIDGKEKKIHEGRNLHHSCNLPQYHDKAANCASLVLTVHLPLF